MISIAPEKTIYINQPGATQTTTAKQSGGSR
jgi:hypothetical protein